MTLQRRAKPEELCCHIPGTKGNIRTGKQGYITQQGMHCSHAKHRMELGEVRTAALKGRLEEEVELLQCLHGGP